MIRGLFVVALLAAAPLTAQSVRLTEEPADYHGEPYNSAVPETLTGARVILDDEEAHALWQAGEAVWIDVFPHSFRPPNLPEGTLFREKKRDSIPGSIWLPNVGYDRIATETDTYFRAGLKAATGGDKDATVVIFCRADCWMSWNAAKRAMEEYGYTDIVWYPDGSDGWEFMEYPSARVVPYELPD